MRRSLSARRWSALIGLALTLATSATSIAMAAEADRPGVETLTLDRAIELALAKGPSVATAMLEIKRAQALVVQVRAGSLPTVAANATYLQLDADRTSSPGVIVNPASQFQASLTASVPIVLPQKWVQWSHANDAVRVASVSADEVRRQLAIAVARTYLALVAQHRIIQIAEQARATSKEHLSFTQARFAGGYGNRLDVVRAGQELSSTRAQVEAAGAALARLREALGVLIAADHGVDALDEVTLASPPSPEDAIGMGGKRRSDIRLFRERLAAAHHLVRDRWADYAPTLSLSGIGFYQAPPTINLPTLGFQAQLALSVPLYDGGLRYGQARERELLEQESKIALENGLRQQGADVRAADESQRRATAALAEARDAARLATEALSLANLAYKAGASTNIEVIDAERQARDAQTSAVVAEDAARQAQLDQLIAAGLL